MKRGNTERETLDLNGWGVGDILEGDEGYGSDRIKITAVGEERFLCRWKYKGREEWEPESGNTTLTCREWKRVFSSNVSSHLSLPGASDDTKGGAE